jgi:adenylate kinase family enzyme
MLIGVIGFAGSGKGTVADILVRDHEFHKLSFADALKDSVATIFGWERHLLEGDTNESREFRETVDPWWSKRFTYDVTPRYMLQLMGTEAGRNAFHIDIWIHTVARRMMQFENVVIADARFPNELQFIRDNGGFNVRVERGNNPEWYEIARQANKEQNMNLMLDYSIHYSEWAWIGEKFNYLLTNNGSLAMLEADVKHMLRVHSGPAIMELHSEK